MMPKIITNQHEKRIVQMIRNWPSETPLNWHSVCIGAQGILGWNTKPTRQALNNKLTVKVAFKAKKGQLKHEKQELNGVSRPRTTLDAMKKISRLQVENDALKMELNRMAEVANRLIYNATLAGITRERLMAPLPTVHEP